MIDLDIKENNFAQSFKRFLMNVGTSTLQYCDYVGGVTYLGAQTISNILKRKIPYQLVFLQTYHLGLRSLSLTNLVAIFTGMVLALQFIVGLKRFGLELYVGQVVGIAICRELGPVLTALMVAARVGSGIAAEIGSMTVTEQVLAIKALGADPVVKLVVPRVLVVTLVTPMLTIFADVIGILGGMVVTSIETGISPSFYLDQIYRTVEIQDFLSGIGKTFFFGFLIGIISCHRGLITTRGTQGVGLSTTRSVVVCSIAVFVADYFLTKLFLII